MSAQMSLLSQTLYTPYAVGVPKRYVITFSPKIED